MVNSGLCFRDTPSLRKMRPISSQRAASAGFENTRLAHLSPGRFQAFDAEIAGNRPAARARPTCRSSKSATHAAAVRTIAGAVVNGADLMVTTQLTGCAIPFHLNGATLVAAHVQPAGKAEDMTADLRANGRLTMAPDMTGVFGATAPKGNSVLNYQKDGFYNYCIGVRIGGSWNLYAQQRPKAYGNHVGAALDAWRIT